MKGHWWLTEGVIIDWMGEPWYITEKDGELYLGDDDRWEYLRDEVLSEIKPRGVPFDCMPVDTESIRFYPCNGTVDFFKGKYILQTITFHHCPDEWKGKTFTVTDELRESLKR